MKFHLGDTVQVMRGKEKGKQGKILKILAPEDRVLIEKINIVVKHKKAQSGQPGELLKKEAPVHASNVMLICPHSKKPTRIGFQMNAKGKKERVSKKAGKALV